MTNRTQLLPGVFLTAVQSDKFKTGCFSVNFLRPLSRAEAAANALIPNVLLRGSEAYPDISAISARLDTLYGASVGTLVRKKGEVQLTGFYADFVEDRYVGEPVFAQMMDFVAELLLHPIIKDGGFAPDFVEGEARNLANAIAARVNDKRSYAVYRLICQMCEGEKFSVSRLGELEDLKKITPQSLFAHYKEVLEASRVELFYMGSKSQDEAAEILREAFKALPRGKLLDVSTEPVYKTQAVREISETMDVTQGKLSMGFRTGITAGDKDYAALLMLTTIFGGGMTSKLFTKVREEMGLCYYASASVEKYKGILAVSSGIECSCYETAKAEILRQLEDCREGIISDYEFDSAKRYLLSDCKAALDSPGRLDDYDIGLASANLTGSIEDLAAQLEAVTREQVQAAAKKLRLDTIFFLKGETA